MDDYLVKIIGHWFGAIKLSPGALIFVNTLPAALDQNPLGRVKAVKSKQVFCDPESGRCADGR